MLHQVEAGLGGVVAQRAVVDARLGAVGAVLLLQVLRVGREERRLVRWRSEGLWGGHFEDGSKGCACLFGK